MDQAWELVMGVSSKWIEPQPLEVLPFAMEVFYTQNLTMPALESAHYHTKAKNKLTKLKHPRTYPHPTQA
jgi:hypothetical protein